MSIKFKIKNTGMSDEIQYYGGAFKYVGVVKNKKKFRDLKLHDVILRVRSVSRRKINRG